MLKFIIWLLWDFTGLRFLFRKLFPPKYTDTEGRTPSTIVLWLMEFYLLAYAGAYQRYVNRVTIIETRANSIYRAQLDPDLEKRVIEQCPHVLKKP